jgi:hypothetical protein
MNADKHWRWIGIALWVLVLLYGGLIFYVNHYMPHGPMRDTGDVVCENDDQGPCREWYLEDMRGLHIPEWAKFLKGDVGVMSWVGLLCAAIINSARPKGGYKKQKSMRDN